MTPNFKRLLEYLNKYYGKEVGLVMVASGCIEALDDIVFVAFFIFERWVANLPDVCLNEKYKALMIAIENRELCND